MTVTFWPADVDNVKLDMDTLTTVPDDPPEAGPDRALDPAPPDPRPPAEPLRAAVAEGDVAVAEDVPQAASPITAHIRTAVMVQRLLLFDSNRRTPGRRCCLAMVTGSDESGEDAGGGGPDVALETGRAGTVSWGLVGS
ncbi:MAG TPA: hypothetical protein VHJ99_03160 [Candidatus Dormibacteraeota bacterium]|nr:hypothetical protein [Candidatus Dormibacteraeota bacterium]